MQTYSVALPLPNPICSRLNSLCYGLPHVVWTEKENFHLTIRYFGSLSPLLFDEVQNHLTHLFFRPFFLVLKGAGYFSSKKGQGKLWIGVEDNVHLLHLRREIDKHLRHLTLPAKQPFHPHITLGSYNYLNLQKLGDFLFCLQDYQSEPIEIKDCVLLSSQDTSKRKIHHVVHHYIASEPIDTND